MTLGAETAIALYRSMLRIRRVEEEIVERYSEQEMRCPVHLCIGQEAIAAGVCHALQHDDQVVSGHRSHGHFLAKGGDMRAMMAEIYGKAAGCSGGKGGSMHLIDLEAGFLGATPIVGSTISIGVGAALAARLRGEDRVVVVFFGDAAVETGTFHESLNFAATQALPVVFLCENNLYSVYSPLEVRQPPGREIVELARSHGIYARSGDGNDVEEVYRSAREAVEFVRGGGGPSFLELFTYRWREHCGPNMDDDLHYRPPGELEDWSARCPLARSRDRLITSYAVSAATLQDAEDAITQEIREAFAFAKASPFPDSNSMSSQIFAT